MIVIKKDEVKPIDVAELLNVPALKGITIKWLVHKGTGDGRYGRHFAMRRYFIPGGMPFPAHLHDYQEAFFVLSGKMSFEDEEKETEVGPGDVVYTYPNEMHGGKVISKEPCEVLCVINCMGDGLNCDPEKQAQAIKTK